MDGAAREPPQEPRVHRAEAKLAALRALPSLRHLVEQPADLGAGEVRVQHEAGLAPELGLVPVGLEALAEGRRAATLPDDGAVHGAARRALPQHRGLALVGDADGRDLGRRDSRGAQSLADRLRRRLPDLPGVVLDPARLRVVLRKLDVAASPHRALRIHHERAGARGALIQRQDEPARRHRFSSVFARSGWSVMRMAAPESITRCISTASLTVQAPTPIPAFRASATVAASTTVCSMPTKGTAAARSMPSSAESEMPASERAEYRAHVAMSGRSSRTRRHVGAPKAITTVEAAMPWRSRSAKTFSSMPGYRARAASTLISSSMRRLPCAATATTSSRVGTVSPVTAPVRSLRRTALSSATVRSFTGPAPVVVRWSVGWWMAASWPC